MNVPSWLIPITLLPNAAGEISVRRALNERRVRSRARERQTAIDVEIAVLAIRVVADPCKRVSARGQRNCVGAWSIICGDDRLAQTDASSSWSGNEVGNAAGVTVDLVNRGGDCHRCCVDRGTHA